MTFTLGFSPCPNDTFIFDALVNQKIDTGAFRFEYTMEDVETLNRWALQGKLDITKISYGALSGILPMYQVLNAGGALGMGVGPLLVAARPTQPEEVNTCTIALPGEHTTAHMLFSMAFPQARKKTFRLFSEIEQAVLAGEVDLGVIIHENRFTYAEKGLICLMDLGEHWEKKTGSPIPLGGIVMKRGYDRQLMKKVDALIQQSVLYARQQYPELSDFIRCHAQEMDEKVMRQHIDLYVNDFSIELGPQGRSAVLQMLETAATVLPEQDRGTSAIFC
jgi:1,4-dihydroxy-6-naphthoate synthase